MLAAADALAAYRAGRDDDEARVGALLEAKFVLRVTQFLEPKGRRGPPRATRRR